MSVMAAGGSRSPMAALPARAWRPRREIVHLRVHLPVHSDVHANGQYGTLPDETCRTGRTMYDTLAILRETMHPHRSPEYRPGSYVTGHT